LVSDLGRPNDLGHYLIATELNRIIAWLGVPDKTHNQRSPPIAQIAYFPFSRVKLIELGVDAVDARFVPLAVDLHNPTTNFGATVGS
jgi:hypothetical protein